MILYKGLLNGITVSLLYLSYRYSDNIEMFTVSMVGVIYFIVKIYQADKFN